MFGLDNNQREAIGLNFVLGQLAPASPYGIEKLREIAPFTCEAALNRCFDNIKRLMCADLEDLRDILAHFKNIRGILVKLSDGVLNEVELFEIKGFLLTLERFLPIWDKINTDAQLWDISFKPMAAALDVLDPQKSRVAPFSLDDGFSEDLAAARHSKSWEEQAAEELRVMTELAAKLRPFSAAFYSNIDNLGHLDLTMAKATLAASYGCARPKISKANVVLKDITNPMVAAALAESGRAMTPVSPELNAGVTIITGANMGGKSVAIKTAALNVALCALGLYVFASKAEIPLFDGIFMISQDLQNTAAGLSSFGGEVARLNALAPRLGNDFLFIALDEPARATNPAEGAAIVRAVAAWLAASRCVCLMSTHYDGITAPNAGYYRVAGLTNLPQSAGPANIADYMDYNLVVAKANDPIPKDALKICGLLGLDGGLMAKIEGEYTASAMR